MTGKKCVTNEINLWNNLHLCRSLLNIKYANAVKKDSNFFSISLNSRSANVTPLFLNHSLTYFEKNTPMTGITHEKKWLECHSSNYMDIRCCPYTGNCTGGLQLISDAFLTSLVQTGSLQLVIKLSCLETTRDNQGVMYMIVATITHQINQLCTVRD